MAPLVSVVMPMRDAAPFVERAVSSILAQTMGDFELLVVDDGSSDDGPRLVEELIAGDRRASLIRSAGHGVVDALNTGCAEARGRYVARMDADDVALTFRFEVQTALLESRRDVGIVGGQMECADDRGRVAWRAVYPVDDAGIRAMIADANPFAHPTVIFRRELLDLAGGFRGNCRYAEDFDLWCRMLDHAEGANLDEVVVHYRVHIGQSTLARARQQTLSSLAVRAAHPIRVATGTDPLADHELITEQVVFDLGVAPEDVRRALVESAVVVARHTRRLGQTRLARLVLEDAVALCSSGPLPDGQRPVVWRALASEALHLGLLGSALTAAARGRGADEPGEVLAAQMASVRSLLVRAGRSVRVGPARLVHARRRLSGSGASDGASSGTSPRASGPVGDHAPSQAVPPASPAGEDWWRADLELSIWAWRVGELDAGRRACQRLLSGGSLPAPVEAAVRSNATWYAPLLAEWVDGARFAELAAAVREGWSAFNPSIAADGDQFRAIVRSANYRLREDTGYDVSDPEGVIRSENYIISLDEDLSVLETRTLREPPGRSMLVSDFPVRGYEDCRLFAAEGCWHALATVRDRDDEGWCRMALLDLDGSEVVCERLLDSPQRHRHEKNWVPFPRGEGTCLVYSWEPTTVLSLHLGSGRVREISSAPGSGLSANVRGGTPGVPLGGGWLFLVHECVWMPDGRRRYPHRFVLLGEDLTVTAASRLFFFLDHGIEFAAGLAADGDDLVVSFGSRDAAAWCARAPVGAVLEAMERDLPPEAGLRREAARSPGAR
jgi:hypothetical protein